jgi:hypothetical protein
MAFDEYQLDIEDVHPIDIVETLAAHHEWEFDRVTDDQISMVIEGQWRAYSITLLWSAYDQTLRMICTFEMEPAAHALPKLYALLNLINDKCWAGAFTYWPKRKMTAYRYGLVLGGDQMATADQIGCMVNIAVLACERYYPAFQLASWGDQTPEQALQVAIAQTYGRA